VKYSVKFPTASIEKKFHKVLESVSPRKIQDEIMEAVEKLAENPRPLGEPKIKPPLIVYQFSAQYRIRIGSWRVLYDVDDERKTVWVLALRKRDERTYKDLR
jgi:mRNA interferase RelE/StbE